VQLAQPVRLELTVPLGLRAQLAIRAQPVPPELLVLMALPVLRAPQASRDRRDRPDPLAQRVPPV